MKRPAQLVFIPAPGVGHIVSTVEIAKQLIARDHQLSITILVMKLPYESSSSKQKATHDNSSSSHDRINFINLPKPEIEMNSGFTSFINPFIERHKPHVKEAVTKLLTEPAYPESSQNPRLAGFVVDMFCTTMIDVANEFGVPSYVFYTSSAACLTFLFHLQSLGEDHGQDVSELIDSKTEFAVPSFVNPVPTSVFPSVVLDREDVKGFLHHVLRFRETKGILINSLSELQSSAVHYLSNDTTIPPVYPVGPILSLKSGTEDSQVDSEQLKQKSHIFKWLDDQLPLSVVFLCFGSMGSFDEAQVKEIAWALEHSGFRFLWSLRQPQPKGKMGMPSDYADFKEVLPEGFLNRTVGIGKIIGWAPQTEILAHPAIGGFISHCGWNSTLESLWYSVPIATWPLYAEQQFNAFELLKELGLGVEIKMDYRTESEVVLSAKDIERGIRQLMVEDSEIRKKTKEIGEKSHKALMEGGSSYSSLGNFIDQI